MKRISCLVFAVILMQSFSFGQAKLATAEYQKSMQPALEIEVPFPQKTILNAIEDKFIKLGYKGKETKGYLTFKGVVLPELGAEAYDVYFNAERKSKREKDFSIVTMMISSGYERFIGDTTNAVVLDKAKGWLNNLTPLTADYDLELQITDQDEIMKKAEKKLNGLIEDAQDLTKKKAKLEKEIADNTTNQANQKSELEKQQQVLQTLKGKRKVAAVPVKTGN
ncbi:MAG: hypothetical protein ACOYKE_03130 [Ferruginibacter sp.]